MTTKNAEPRKMGKDKLGRERRDDLNGRIRTIRNLRYSRRYEDAPDPEHIAKARKLVGEYDRRREQAQDKLGEAAFRAANAAASALLQTDSYDEGLAIVEKLEAEARRRRWIKPEGK